jgi:hypothetical protein
MCDCDRRYQPLGDGAIMLVLLFSFYAHIGKWWLALVLVGIGAILNLVQQHLVGSRIRRVINEAKGPP